MTVSCPAGCTSPLCEYNVDPAGELQILGRNRHYGEGYVIELLLHNTGIRDLGSDNTARSERVMAASSTRASIPSLHRPRKPDGLEKDLILESTIGDSRASSCFGYQRR